MISFKDDVMLSSTVINPSYMNVATPQLPGETAMSSDVVGDLSVSEADEGKLRLSSLMQKPTTSFTIQ